MNMPAQRQTRMSALQYYKAGSTSGSEFTEIWFAPDPGPSGGLARGGRGGKGHLEREPQCIEAMVFEDGRGWIRRLVMDGLRVMSDFAGNPKTEQLSGRVQIRRCEH
jgi:hypothetical protein